MKALRSFYALACLYFIAAVPVRGDDKKTDPTPVKPAITATFKEAPENIEDLKALQARVKALLKKVVPATVCVQVGGASGSGIIIDKEGHVLTAGHVSGAPGREAVLIFSDGRRIKAKTLGNNRGIDSGMLKITDKGEFPHVEMGKSADLKRGQWVVAVGHPGGFHPRRTPPVRLGRVLDSNRNLVRSDCTLVGGDSGGPLFDLDGKVVGIHSRIAGNITDNIHVPVDTYRETWDRLVSAAEPAYMGVELDPDAANCIIKKVTAGSPAEKAGLKEGDVLLTFAGQKVEKSTDLAPMLGKKKAGDSVALEVMRGEETVKLEIQLGRRE